MVYVCNTDPKGAGSFIIESKLFTQTKFREKWGKTNVEKCLHVYLFIFLNHKFHIWNFAILTDSCLPALF